MDDPPVARTNGRRLGPGASLGVLGLLAGLAIGWLLWRSSPGDPGPGSAEALPGPGPEASVEGVSIAHDPILGPSDARITIVEFSDFECPFCTKFAQETAPLLRRQYGDDVRWVFVNNPLQAIHPRAYDLALAGECAHEQDRFTPFFGGGPRRTDCMMRVDVEGVRGKPRGKAARCTDGDIGCDADGTVDGVCTFRVRLCLGDIPAPAPCHADVVTGAALLSTDPSFSAVGAALAALPMPAPLDTCTAEVEVPLSTATGRARARFLAEATMASGAAALMALTWDVKLVSFVRYVCSVTILTSAPCRALRMILALLTMASSSLA